MAISRPGVSTAIEWFIARTLRERMILIVGAFVLLTALFINGVWRPIGRTREAALQRLELQESLIATMRSDGVQLRALSVSAPIIRTVPAATAITDEAAGQKITIQRLERDGGHFRVVVDNVAFPALIAWLDKLESAHGLRVSGLELDRRPAPGIVSAHVTLDE